MKGIYREGELERERERGRERERERERVQTPQGCTCSTLMGPFNEQLIQPLVNSFSDTNCITNLFGH